MSGACSCRIASTAQLAAGGVLALALAVLLGYAYGAPLTRPGTTASVAPHTIAGLAVLAVGLLAARPAEGFVRALLADEPGGLMARSLLPVAFVALPALGGLRLAGQSAGLFRLSLGVGIMVLTSLAVLTAVVALTGARLNELGRQRTSALERLAASDRRLRRTLDNLVRAQDTERRRLAMDMHDDTLPALSAISLQLGVARVEGVVLGDEHLDRRSRHPSVF